MPSKNQRIEIPAPVSGVRRDLDPLAMPPDALERAVNVIARQGVLVPRAAHTALSWYTDGGWTPLYETTLATRIAYCSVGTKFLVALSDGTILYSADEFATTAIYSGFDVPGGGSSTSPKIEGLCYDATNTLFIALCSDGSIYTAPNTWPTAGSWTQRLDGDSGSAVAFYHDQANNTTLALLYVSGLETPRLYYSTNGTTWDFCSSSNLGHIVSGQSRIGIGGEGTPATYAFITAEKSEFVEYLLSVAIAKLDETWDDTVETAKYRWDFCGGGSVTCCIYDDGSECLVQSSDDLGATWTDELGAGLGYTEGRYANLFYDETLGWLVVGAECHRSADGLAWDEYPPPPFASCGCFAAVSDGTDWFIVAANGVWKFPSTELADQETITSIYQMDTDDVQNQVFISTDKSILKLNATTGEFTNVDDLGTVAFDASSQPRNLRTVFRSFECIPPDTLPGGTTYKRVLLATNPTLDLCYWYSSETAPGPDLHYCGTPSTAAPGSKVLLTAANRVILANGPASSAHGVDASNSLDIANGWDGLNLAILADTPGEITAGMELSALQFAIFKEDAVYHGMAQTEFAGVATAFRYEMIRAGIQGPVAPHALLKTPSGMLCYLGQDGGVYMYDGGSPRDIGVHVRRMVADQMDFDNRDHSWGFVDPIERLVHFFFPTVAGKMNRGVTVDLESGSAWEVQLPSWFNAAAGSPLFITKDLTWNDFSVTWGDMLAAWNSFQSGYYYVVLGSEVGTWGSQNWNDIDSYTDFGSPISVYWRPGWAPLGDIDSYSTLLEIRHRMALIGASDVFTCRAFALDAEFEESEESDEDNFGADTDYYTTEFDLDGNLFRYSMEAEITKRFVWGGGVARYRGGRGSA